MTTPQQPFVRWAETAKDNGYLPVPMNGKKPAIRNWNSPRPLGNAAIRNLVRNPRYSSANLGFRTGKLVAVDIDHGERDTVDRIRHAAFGMLGHTPFVRIGRRPRLTLFYRADDEVQSVSAGKVDILGKGKVAVVEGIHPETALPYDWPEESLVDSEFSALPLIQPSDLEHFVDWAARFQDDKRTASSRKIDAALQAVVKQISQPKREAELKEGKRNRGLFVWLKDQAATATTLQELVVEAQTFNLRRCRPPLPDSEVRAVASSAWKYKEHGRLLTSGHQSVVLPICKEAVLRTSKSPEAVFMFALLKATRSKQPFTIPQKATADLLRWGPNRVKKAIDVLISEGWVVRVDSKKYEQSRYAWGRL